MLGKVKEYILENSETGIDIFPEISGGGTVSALEIKPNADTVVTVNGDNFEVASGEVLSFPYNYMKINSLSFGADGVRAIIRYLIE